MSKLNGDRARFQKDRKRKMRLRERLHVVMAGLRKPAEETVVASLRAHDEGGQVRNGE